MTFPRSCIRFFHDCREATLLSLWGNKLVGRDQREMSNVVEGNKSGLIRLSRLFCVPALKHALADDQCYFDSEGVAMTTASIDFFFKTYSVFGDQVFTYSGQAGAALSTLPFTEQPAIIYWKWDSSSDTEPRMTTHSFHLGLAFIKRETGTK